MRTIIDDDDLVPRTTTEREWVTTMHENTHHVHARRRGHPRHRGVQLRRRESAKTDLESVATDVGNAVDEAGEDAAETVARNIAAKQGEEAFQDAGHELDGDLTCEAKVADGLSKLDISCTGTTKDGKPAAMLGTTNELPGADANSLEGTFTGTVADEEAFVTDDLGG